MLRMNTIHKKVALLKQEIIILELSLSRTDATLFKTKKAINS